MAASITKRDWEEFMAVGRVPPSVRELVLQSWQRSVQGRVTGLKRAPQLAESELGALREQSRRLRRAARGALEKAGYLMNHTGSMLLLCDRAGVVLDVAGDTSTQARGRENHLHLGGTWGEGAIGTNAIGTAIHLMRPVQLNGVEHFCEEIQRWNCAAAPVSDPATGQLLGVVDISWPEEVEQANVAALSAALAMQIESDLGLRMAQDRQVLIERLQMRRLRRGGAPMLVMDRTGADVLATEDFLRFCADDRALAALRARIPDLIELPPERMAEQLADCLPGTDLEIVAQRDEAIGVMLSLRRSRPRVDTGAELARIGRIGAETGRICAQAQRLAATRIPILIEGEAGTGKSFLAQAVYRASPQASGGFEMLDCSSLTAEGLRADLAGGTRRSDLLDRLAREGGVLCLDHPGATPPDAQKLLLGLIEELTARNPEGLRLLSLCSRALYQAMQAGEIRPDLYYRVAAARLVLPPLRTRREEVVPSLKMIAARHAEQGGRELRFTSGALAVLEGYDWPGNLREMANLIATLDALSPTGLIDAQTLPPEIRSAQPEGEETLRDMEKSEILEAIDAAQGNLTEAARRLGIARSTLYLKLDAYGIMRPRKG